MSNIVFSNAVRQAFKQSNGMPPVAKGKNPLVGFAMGFLFGPIGVGLYLKSWGDFFLTLTIVLVGSFVTAGVAAPVLWCVSGAWAYKRIHDSNKPPSDSSITNQASAPLLTSHESDVSSNGRENVVVRSHAS